MILRKFGVKVLRERNAYWEAVVISKQIPRSWSTLA